MRRSDIVESVTEILPKSTVAVERAGQAADIAIGLLLDWLVTDEADEELAAILLRDRPGDTDLTGARQQVCEVLDVLIRALNKEFGGLI